MKMMFSESTGGLYIQDVDKYPDDAVELTDEEYAEKASSVATKPMSDAEAWDKFKRNRSLMLRDTDWTQGADARNRLGQELCARWDKWRQDICDIPQNQTDPHNLIIPEKPA